MGGRKRLDRVLESLVPSAVGVEVQRICASEGGLIVAVDDYVVIPGLLEIHAGLHGSVEEKLGLAELQEVRAETTDDVLPDLGRQLLEDQTSDEGA